MVQADRLIRELQSSNRLLKSELQATTTTFKQALHAAQTMLDTGIFAPPYFFPGLWQNVYLHLHAAQTMLDTGMFAPPP